MRKQRAFKDLTELEIDQIANWLRTDTYETVLERIRKPRPEGFGLTISRKPLELLHAKKNTVDKINQKIATGEKLSIAELDNIVDGGRRDFSDDLHIAILETAYELFTSEENTPTRLLALQRLADFPERAELRVAKEERQIEMHTHRLAMNAHRTHIAEERLNLSKKSFDLRERLAFEKANSALSTRHSALADRRGPLPPGHYIDENGRECDPLGPLPASIDDGDAISARARKKFGIIKKGGMTSMPSQNIEAPVESGVPPDPLDRADAAALSPEQSRLRGSNSSSPAPAPASPRTSTGSACRAGDTDAKNESSVSALSKDQLPIPNSRLPEASSLASFPSVDEQKREAPKHASEGESLPPVQEERREAPDSKCQMKNARCSMFNETVVSHAIRRWRAYQPRRYQDPEPTTSWTDECPCGVKIPCEKHGLLWNSVRYMTPSDPKYAALLQEAGILHYIPTTDELTRSESTDMPCTSVFYVKRPAVQQVVDRAD